jgi:hypothetical protein
MATDQFQPPEPITITPARPVAVASMHQRWLDLAFIHWPVPPEAVAPTLPRHVRPDVLAGTTYLGLVGLRVRTTIGPTFTVPWLGVFDEIHIRVYSVDRSGRRGAVFLSLNADRLLTSTFARYLLRIPYTWSPSRIVQHDDTVSYSTERRWPPGPSRIAFTVRVGQHISTLTELERFVTARWSLHSSYLGVPIRVDVDHPPWRLHRAELVDLKLDNTFFDELGLPAPTSEPASVLWSPGTRSKVGLPTNI